MERVRVFTYGFWKGFNFSESLLGLALSDQYAVSIVDSPQECDVSFESYFSRRKHRWEKILHRYAGRSYVEEILARRKVRRIFFSGEALPLPIGAHHGVISHEPWLGELTYRLPLWVLYCSLFGETAFAGDPDECGFTLDQLTSVPPNGVSRKFACAIFGNQQHYRYDGIAKLKRFGPVDLFGRAAHRPIPNKLEILRGYRFNLCFENTIAPGYITEKALHAKMAGCIPLWWGDPSYRLDFNEKALVNVYEYGADFERIMDDVDFEEVLNTPLITRFTRDDRAGLAAFFRRTIEGADRRFGDLVPGS